MTLNTAMRALLMGLPLGTLGGAVGVAEAAPGDHIRIGDAEVNQGLWTQTTGKSPFSYGDCGDECPAEMISWYDAVRFANQLSEKAGLSTCYTESGKSVTWPEGFDCNGFRLPTEAEWEYCARAGENFLYAGSDNIDEVAWHHVGPQDAQPCHDRCTHCHVPFKAFIWESQVLHVPKDPVRSM